MKVECTCGKEMEMKEQDETKKDVVQLKYECSCGNTGLVLEYKNKPYDLYIKDPSGKLMKYYTDVNE